MSTTGGIHLLKREGQVEMALELHTDSGLEAAFAAEDGAHQRPCSRLCGFFPKHSHAPLPQLPDTRQRGEGPQACLTHPGALLPTAKYGNKDLGVPQGVQAVTCTSRLGWRPESSAHFPPAIGGVQEIGSAVAAHICWFIPGSSTCPVFRDFMVAFPCLVPHSAPLQLRGLTSSLPYARRTSIH